MPTYPPPERNPHCRCTDPMQAFFCPTGHMSECHYPYDCVDAGCSHLGRYPLSDAEVKERQAQAVAALTNGLPEYRLADDGVTVEALQP